MDYFAGLDISMELRRMFAVLDRGRRGGSREQDSRSTAQAIAGDHWPKRRVARRIVFSKERGAS